MEVVTSIYSKHFLLAYFRYKDGYYIHLVLSVVSPSETNTRLADVNDSDQHDLPKWTPLSIEGVEEQFNILNCFVIRRAQTYTHSSPEFM